MDEDIKKKDRKREDETIEQFCAFHQRYTAILMLFILTLEMRQAIIKMVKNQEEDILRPGSCSFDRGICSSVKRDCGPLLGRLKEPEFNIEK